MSALPIREELISTINKLSDKQMLAVLEFIKSVKLQDVETEYNEEDDPLVGFFSGPPDLAETSEEILWKEFGLKKPQDVQEE